MSQSASRSLVFFASGLMLSIVFGLAGCGGKGSTPPPPPPPPPPPSTNPDDRADAMLKLMTQAEKLAMVMGGVTVPDGVYNYSVPRGAGGWVPGNTRLNIPALYLADGSAGASLAGLPATALPSSLAS